MTTALIHNPVVSKTYPYSHPVHTSLDKQLVHNIGQA